MKYCNTCGQEQQCGCDNSSFSLSKEEILTLIQSPVYFGKIEPNDKLRCIFEKIGFKPRVVSGHYCDYNAWFLEDLVRL